MAMMTAAAASLTGKLALIFPNNISGDFWGIKVVTLGKKVVLIEDAIQGRKRRKKRENFQKIHLPVDRFLMDRDKYLNLEAGHVLYLRTTVIRLGRAVLHEF